MTASTHFRVALSYASASPERFTYVLHVADRVARAAHPSFERATLTEST